MSTLSVVIGNNKCNYNCVYCISKATYHPDQNGDEPIVDFVALRKSCEFAKRNGINTAILTGKGEPTLYPHQVNTVVDLVSKYFPVVELQTNGSRLTPAWLRHLKELGLTTVAISCASLDDKQNKELMGATKPIGDIIKMVRESGLLTRLTVVVTRKVFPYVTLYTKLFEQFVQSARTWGVHQITFRNLNPDFHMASNADKKVIEQIKELSVPIPAFSPNFDFDSGFPIIGYTSWGNPIYDIHDVAVTVSDCVQLDFKKPIRSYIYMGDGHLYYSWDRKSAIVF